MAPDLNSVPASPRPAANSMSAPQQISQQSSATTSRRASQIFPMSPPPLPLASPGGTLPVTSQHGHLPFPPLSPSLTGPFPSVDASGVPMRHPRPLTAAELHMECEKEQEAVVNRLTRELSNLRAHSASVASTASSTSNNPGLLLDTSDPATTHGPTHPTGSRRHRSSSSVSRTSAGIPLNATTVGIPHQHRYSGAAQQERDVRSASVVSTPRYEEVAHYKLELDDAKRENDMLRRRIRELEGLVRERRGSTSGSEVGRRGRSGAGERVATDRAAAVSNREGSAAATQDVSETVTLLEE
ncbi:uncharacterized protein BDZ99DRAFT_511869 [Mytilinidion resinicola]|uniref:Uncharacterized protein n=1 Tax=Mytilinidion resinicola TaxID=574789 RepID=A0A6A6Y4Y4_9PEZI|nr:uncharacterized protein BDZ99DRAFT_511869 [Mytilinidion resinicola]KAF2803720.1 hypothetical protein BDZ99DRAFT_511869 [Mytilinidion resinicola]